MTTWIDVMKLAQALRAKRDAANELDGQDAERLLTMVLDFHRRAVVATPSSERRPDEALPRPSR
ncbi:MAG TPA: hypothetical protein VIJ22_18265 [Polyangiaceae bacterium]